MANEKDQSSEGRLSLALAAIIVYIALLYWNPYNLFSLSFGSVILFAVLLYGIFILNPKENFVQLVLFACFWFASLFILWLSPKEWKFPATLLLLSIVLTLTAKWETRILVVGFTMLNIWFFGATVLSLIEFLVIVLFIYSALKGVGPGLIMLIPLLAVGWFIGSGWGNYVEQKVDSIGTQIGAETGVTPAFVGSKVTAALNNTWLMLTDPEEYYRRTFIDKGQQDEGSFALEVKSIEAIPQEVSPERSFKVIFDIVNAGKETAKDVYVIATGDDLTEACGEINGKTCSPACGAPETINDVECKYAKKLNDIPKNGMRYESIPFTAPVCPGTYDVGAIVSYNYTAYATLPIELISSKEYNTLLETGKLNPQEALSESSAGPFKITIRTSRDQPIPDDENFTLFVGLINNREGTAKLNGLSLYVPTTLQAMVNDKKQCRLSVINEKNPLYEKKEGYIQYAPTEEGLEIDQNSLDYVECDFKVKEGEKISMIKTFQIMTRVDYTFTYQKKTSVTVRSAQPGLGVSKPDCIKKLHITDATAKDQEVAQAKDAIINSLARKIASCYMTYDGLGEPKEASCGSAKIFFRNCMDKISKTELADAAIEASKDASGAARIKAENIKLIMSDGTEISELSGNKIYDGAITFNSNGWAASSATLALESETSTACESTTN